MDRNGISRECVHGEHVERLGRLALERKPRIAEHNVDLGFGVFQKSELRLCKFDVQRVDLIERVVIAGTAVAGQGSCPQTDDADSQRCP